MLLNSEVWYPLSENDIEELEIEDRQLMRAILGAPEGSPNELLYLELGCIPIKQIITCRRLNFLRDILAKNENDILHKFFLMLNLGIHLKVIGYT